MAKTKTAPKAAKPAADTPAPDAATQDEAPAEQPAEAKVSDSERIDAIVDTLEANGWSLPKKLRG